MEERILLFFALLLAPVVQSTGIPEECFASVAIHVGMKIGFVGFPVIDSEDCKASPEEKEQAKICLEQMANNALDPANNKDLDLILRCNIFPLNQKSRRCARLALEKIGLVFKETTPSALFCDSLISDADWQKYVADPAYASFIKARDLFVLDTKPCREGLQCTHDQQCHSGTCKGTQKNHCQVDSCIHWSSCSVPNPCGGLKNGCVNAYARCLCDHTARAFHNITWTELRSKMCFSSEDCFGLRCGTGVCVCR